MSSAKSRCEDKIADNSRFPTVRIGGLNTAVATRFELAQRMVMDCQSRDANSAPKLVFSSNGQGISYAKSNLEFSNAMRAADIVHADGMSVVFASKLLTRQPLPERVATTDFFHDAAKAAVQSGLSFYIFGGTESQNAKAVEGMLRLYPGLTIVGRRNGYFQPDDEDAICRKIRESGADVLWVGLGKPLQEYWSVRNRERLCGLGWIKTCGGLYGYLAGEEKRAPEWVQYIGAEWFYRTLQSPRRLAWRYVVTNFHSVWCIVRDSW